MRCRVTSTRPTIGLVIYEFRIRGHLGPSMVRAFAELRAQCDGEDTLLRGAVKDQAALHGVLAHIEALGLDAPGVRIDRGNEPRGWRGDVAQVRLDTRRMEALGWKAKMTSGEAVKRAIGETVAQLA